MMNFLSENPLALLIAACEVGFWVMLGAGLMARYLLQARRVSAVLLLGVPALDVVLVAASLADVAGGSPPGLTHGLAAVYLGFTVAFGHSMIRWADAHVAHRFAGGPPPARPPKYGTARVVYEWREWSKAALAWVVTLGVLLITAVVAGTGVPAPPAWTTDPMWTWGAQLSLIVGIWLIGWPVWTTLEPPREPKHVDA